MSQQPTFRPTVELDPLMLQQLCAQGTPPGGTRISPLRQQLEATTQPMPLIRDEQTIVVDEPLPPSRVAVGTGAPATKPIPVLADGSVVLANLDNLDIPSLATSRVRPSSAPSVIAVAMTPKSSDSSELVASFDDLVQSYADDVVVTPAQPSGARWLLAGVIGGSAVGALIASAIYFMF